MTQITDHIWIGDDTDTERPDLLKAAGITTLLCVAADLRPRLGWPEFVVDQVGLQR